MHIHMNGFILIKKIYIQDYHQKTFSFNVRRWKRGKGDGHISNDKYLHLKNVWNTKTF